MDYFKRNASEKLDILHSNTWRHQKKGKIKKEKKTIASLALDNWETLSEKLVVRRWFITSSIFERPQLIDHFYPKALIRIRPFN